jgi:hypothetical protein
MADRAESRLVGDFELNRTAMASAKKHTQTQYSRSLFKIAPSHQFAGD